MRKRLFIYLFFLSFATSKAQSLKIREWHSGKDVSSDTIKLGVVDNGWSGWVGLDTELKLYNVSNKAITVGVHKIEYDTIKKASHSFCFAGNCYDEKTFESPNHATINAGASDSSFSGHLIFDNRDHTPTINLVAYVFYDVNNPNDSSIVYVLFNTVVHTSIPSEANGIGLEVYPNPANEMLTISMNGDKRPLSLQVRNILGMKVEDIQINSAVTSIFYNTTHLLPGIYYFSFLSGHERLASKRIVVTH